MAAKGVVIPWQPHPHLEAGEIERFFSKHGHAFEQTLAPGDVFPLPIDRIHTAEPGWGYKQRLGFGYYPIQKPGRYEMTVVAHGPGAALSAEPFEIVVD